MTQHDGDHADATSLGSTADPWYNVEIAENLGGPDFGRLLEEFRRLQDAFAGARPPDDQIGDVADDVAAVADRLMQWQAPERQTPAGTRLDLPGRGSPALLPLVVDRWTDDLVLGRVVFSRFHLGGNNAAHGGMLPLLFDEVLGRLANSGSRNVARTAYLTVNYRHITRVGIEHRLQATVTRIEERKRWVTGELKGPDGVVVADAEGLFVELRPGQP